jgi:CHASE2 domain-containing sensor protein
MLRSLPLSPDVVVVDIDNASVSALGRWPWPRNVHARLLDTLARAMAAVVSTCCLPSRRADDRAFSDAMTRVPTFLPVLLSPERRTARARSNRRSPRFAARAMGLGHINLEVDRDGIVRSVALFESDGRVRWPQLMVPVYGAIQGGRLPPLGGAPSAHAHDLRATRRTRAVRLIPFSRSTPAYPTLSFADVLDGRVETDALRGKIVVVGVTASGPV